MKELSIEEKAKAYDEAISIAREYDFSLTGVCAGDVIQDIFPELKESEDEKTKKEIINYLECQSRDEPTRKDTHNKWISYIKKHALSKDDYDFLRNCARVLKIFGYLSYADRLTGLCPTLEEEAKAMMATPIIFDESKDEKIRKDIIWCLKHSGIKESSPINPHVTTIIKDAIAWLEKQGEQNPTNKVEPKFKVGDWIVTNKNHIWYVDENPETPLYLYRLINQYGKVEVAEFEVVDNVARLWTIQDAKDGDVLCCESGWTCIFRALDNHTNTFSSYCFMDSDKWFCNTGCTCHTLDEQFIRAYNFKLHPATKEQRDTLMKAMANAGYTFDFEKRELKKIEQKPAWSEEDEQYLLVCKNALAKYQTTDKWDANIIFHWLENKLKSI